MNQTSATKLVRESWIGQNDRYEASNAASKQFVQDINEIPAALEKPLQEKMEEIHQGSRQIKYQVDKLENLGKQLNKISKQFKTMSDTSRNRIKETGDVQNWAEMIDRDLRVLEETLKIVQENRLENQGGEEINDETD